MQLLSDCQAPEALFCDPIWCAEEKKDGYRMVITKMGSLLSGETRAGNMVPLPEAVEALAMLSESDWIIDGEIMPGARFIAFDILFLNGACALSACQSARRDILAAVSPFPIVRRAVGEEAKRELCKVVKREGGEGIVFKMVASEYRHQRNADWQRYKNYQTEDFRIHAIDPKTGSLELEREGKLFGKVPHKLMEVYQRGQMVRVRYDAVTPAGKLLRGRLVH